MDAALAVFPIAHGVYTLTPLIGTVAPNTFMLDRNPHKCDGASRNVSVSHKDAIINIIWLFIHVMTWIAPIIFIVAMGTAAMFSDFAKVYDIELGMTIVFSFGTYIFMLGIIGLKNGSLYTSTVGEIKMAIVRYPLQWGIGNLLSIGFGIGFLVWGGKIFSKWIISG